MGNMDFKYPEGLPMGPFPESDLAMMANDMWHIFDCRQQRRMEEEGDEYWDRHVVPKFEKRGYDDERFARLRSAGTQYLRLVTADLYEDPAVLLHSPGLDVERDAAPSPDLTDLQDMIRSWLNKRLNSLQGQALVDKARSVLFDQFLDDDQPVHFELALHGTPEQVMEYMLRRIEKPEDFGTLDS